MAEDRLTGRGRTIPVRFVVIPATGADRALDPVVYFAGGPGDSAVDEIPSERTVLSVLNIHRDLVFIEQRGTGQSNPLTCPAFPALADKVALRASVESCLAHLHGDLRFSTTAMYADDVNQLLDDLHYAKVNLIGHLLRDGRRAGLLAPSPGPGADDDAAKRIPARRPGVRTGSRELPAGAGLCVRPL